MSKWEGLGFSRASVQKVIIFSAIAMFIISYIFRYLIKSNKVKPGKISRFFYLDDEQYVKYWGKKRNKGILKFVLYYDVIISIAIWITSLIIIAATDGDFSKLKNTLHVFYGYLFGSTIGCPLRWGLNEEKYEKLTRNME